ncbi:hypothetical protein ACP70R_035835 [Stipagrostis hirtigluma subsp. patula]
MASSNRHWPSMYRSSLACDFPQPQPDMNNAGGGGGGKSSLISSRGEDGTRSSEPKPRWNPRPEQIRILEGIFNAGMVNPPRDEIRRIRAQLQEYGPVADANVFYWFQNRKSRNRLKLRAAGQLPPSGRATVARASALAPPAPGTPPPPLRHVAPRHLLAAAPVAPTSSSSSSSDRSSGSSKSVKPAAAQASPAAAIHGVLAAATAMDFLAPAPAPAPSLAARQLYYHTQAMAPSPATPELITTPETLLLHWQQGSHYLPATELGGVLGTHAPAPAVHAAPSPSVLLGLRNETLGQDFIDLSCSKPQGLAHDQYWMSRTCGTEPSSKTDAVSAVIRDDEQARLGLLHYGFGVTNTTAAAAAAADVVTPAPLTAAATAGTAMTLPSSAPPNAAATSAVLTDQLQGLLDAGLIGGTPATATVVVVARDAVMCTAQFSVPAMRLDVKLVFGDAAVLLRHTGEPVFVDESGITVEPLQKDGLYYAVLRPTEDAAVRVPK